MQKPPATGRNQDPEMDRLRAWELVDASCPGEFSRSEDPESVAGPHRFRHVSSGNWFRLLAGGSFEMGLSDREEQAARALFDPIPANLSEMRPVTTVHMTPFLMAERPVLTKEWLGPSAQHPDSVAYASHDEALEYARRFDLTLPRESQWEYACRGGSSTLFAFGDELPEESILADWLTFDFGAGPGMANAFGLQGLFVGEWCLDTFFDSYEPLPQSTGSATYKVVRGGGAFFWPWQDQEWVWCMSAMRCPSSDLPEGKCGFRLVRNLQQDPKAR